MDINEFDYALPEELIAQKPVRPRDSSRLMVVRENIVHKKFSEVLNYFNSGDVLVVNETKVMRCKIKGTKSSGGPVEVTILRPEDNINTATNLNQKSARLFVVNEQTRQLQLASMQDRFRKTQTMQDLENKAVNTQKNCWWAKIKCRNPLVGNIYTFTTKITGNTFLEGEVIQSSNEEFLIKFNIPITPEIMEQFELPLPPYITRNIENDEEYQTSFAKTQGSVAAPTAGLHFTPELFSALKNKGVIITKICLHVGYGTFLGVYTEKIEDHKMHHEYFEITKENANIINNRKGKLFVVGTTSLRALESSTSSDGKISPQNSNTNIFIYPGYKFNLSIDGMITNFHLPKSTLILLISALFGKENVFSAYQEAIKEKYRFYSLGDACLFLK